MRGIREPGTSAQGEKDTMRRFKEHILNLLEREPLEEALSEFLRLPTRRVLNPLFSSLLSTRPALKWKAVTALGVLVSKLADEEMESARVVMRRLMWQLNDESGGIGWGCPETMGETIARHRGIAEEYSPVLISYIDEGGNFLEYPPLQQGALWGVGRGAEGAPDLFSAAVPHLIPFLGGGHPLLRALSAIALGRLNAPEAASGLESLLNDADEVEVYLDGELHTFRVKDLAVRALLSQRS